MTPAPAKKQEATKTPVKKKPRRFRVTGFEAPLTIDKPDGTQITYLTGDEFTEDEWIMPHVTIPNQLAHGSIEEVN